MGTGGAPGCGSRECKRRPGSRAGGVSHDPDIPTGVAQQAHVVDGQLTPALGMLEYGGWFAITRGADHVSGAATATDGSNALSPTAAARTLTSPNRVRNTAHHSS